jgi:mannose-6-phosphate isomerase-like protein (cupin superfamily)
MNNDLIEIGARTIENPLIGDKVTFIETGAETSGKYTLVEVELAAKGGNGVHYHKNYSETFKVLDGELGVQVGKKNLILKEGEEYTVAPMVLHRFFNPSDSKQALFSVKLEPASSGFEKSLQIAYGLARDNKTNSKGIPKNMVDLGLLFKLSETNLPGFFSIIEPILYKLASRARKNGREKELIDTYCKV